MSGLEKFQANEAWRTNFKKFLFMERKPEVVQNTLSVKESHRYSLDIGEDLKNIIEQKKNKKVVHFNAEIVSTADFTAETNTLKANMSGKENINRYDNNNGSGEVPISHKTGAIFEASERLRENAVVEPNITLSKYPNGDEEKDCNNILIWQKTSDESFEALERMCDKTASDPNSTLFQYLHTDRKEEVLEEVKKKRSRDGIIACDNKKEEELLLKINNCTFLDDIEAPSRIWENTIYDDTIPQTSPIKMVGLLRPSTIMEEANDDSTTSDLSSHMSFSTATKGGVHSDISTNTYETAHDSTGASNHSDISDKYRTKQRKVIDIDQILFTVLDLNGQTQTDESALLETEATIIEPAFSSENNEEKYVSNDVSIDLIDLEKTYGPLQCSKYPSALENTCSEDKDCPEIGNGENEFDNSIIEIMSDDEEKVENLQEFGDGDSNQNNIKIDSDFNLFDNNHEAYGFNDYKENDKENCPENQESSEKSMQFNDTMEEVEYMMKKGMEYMAAEAASKTSPEKCPATIQKLRDSKYSKTRLDSPMKHTKTETHVSSASKEKLSTFITPNKMAPISKASSSASKRFDIDIKPFPKFELQFIKPQSYAQKKDLTSKQHKFSNIVSPIGTYIKKTSQTPLMSSRNCKTKSYFNSSAILELEKESRLYQPTNSTEATGLSKLVDFGSDAKRVLPKKAYISSDVKHIVDERTPVKIPCGKKIQKYIENVMTPAVLRHEGKLKVADSTSGKLNTPTLPSLGGRSKLPLKVSDTNCTDSRTISRVPRRNNASLADLSLMSGDISMYTIMDAQKF